MSFDYDPPLIREALADEAGRRVDQAKANMIRVAALYRAAPTDELGAAYDDARCELLSAYEDAWEWPEPWEPEEVQP